MQTSGALASSQQGRLQALKARHTALKDKIRKEEKSPAAAYEEIKRLKLEKLKLKEEIEEEMSRA